MIHIQIQFSTFLNACVQRQQGGGGGGLSRGGRILNQGGRGSYDGEQNSKEEKGTLL